MNFGIADKLALVTGSSRGIGRAIAIALAREGARVMLVARNQRALDEVASKLSGPPGRHQRFAVDLTQPEELARLTRTLQSDPGPPEIIVHNLGGSLGVTDPLASSESWIRVWQFNVGIPLELNRVFLPSMQQRKWGRVVHLSTLSTKTFTGYPAYVSAKAALDAYVTGVGRAVARDGVVMSAVAPGAIHIPGRFLAKLQTEDPAAMEEYYRNHLSVGRLGTVDEIAATVAFLCSVQASYVTGAIVPVDGGWM